MKNESINSLFNNNKEKVFQQKYCLYLSGMASNLSHSKSVIQHLLGQNPPITVSFTNL